MQRNALVDRTAMPVVDTEGKAHVLVARRQVDNRPHLERFLGSKRGNCRTGCYIITAHTFGALTDHFLQALEQVHMRSYVPAISQTLRQSRPTWTRLQNSKNSFVTSSTVFSQSLNFNRLTGSPSWLKNGGTPEGTERIAFTLEVKPT